MRVYGLHVLDLIVVLMYLVGMMAVGAIVARSVKSETDYYLSGRTLGRWFQFFLNFGNMTDANGAASVSSEVFRQGVGGVWIALQTLFMTPFYWFSAVWFRRSRVVTMADLFVERFDSKKLAALYALFNVLMATIMIGVGYLAAYKVMSAMLVKPEAIYSTVEAQDMADYQEYQGLKLEFEAGTLEQANKPRFDLLQNQYKRNELKAFISYIQPFPFYVIYGLIVGVYIVLGGLKAAVITDAFQGILIIVFSVLLIPIGLFKSGGFSGIHEKVPEYMFEVFGSVQMSDYAWYTVAAMVLTGLVQLFGLMHNMAVSGSAKDETAARIGAVTGGFAKRFMIIAWMLCGLFAVALFSDQILDPDHTWGILSFNMLAPGLLGLMMAGMLAANMSTVDAAAISVSALFVCNLYEPLFPGRTKGHYMMVGRIATGGALILGILVALRTTYIVPLLITYITLNTVFGAAVFLIFFWRRLTSSSIMIAVPIWVLVIGLLPWLLPSIESVRQSPSLLAHTQERVVHVVAGADQADVDAGRAVLVGETINKERVLPGKAVYFDKVVRAQSANADSPEEGIGRFRIEVYLLEKVGLPVKSLNPSGIITARWLFDGIVPFILLILFSLLTKRAPDKLTNAFYARMGTPVAVTSEEDKLAVARNIAEPERLEATKLFPNTNWQFRKWNRMDTLGFLACWAFVALVVAVLWVVLNLGR
jgi:solute:Na+ symporter, SSS family